MPPVSSTVVPVAPVSGSSFSSTGTGVVRVSGSTASASSTSPAPRICSVGLSITSSSSISTEAFWMIFARLILMFFITGGFSIRLSRSWVSINTGFSSILLSAEISVTPSAVCAISLILNACGFSSPMSARSAPVSISVIPSDSSVSSGVSIGISVAGLISSASASSVSGSASSWAVSSNSASSSSVSSSRLLSSNRSIFTEFSALSTSAFKSRSLKIVFSSVGSSSYISRPSSSSSSNDISLNSGRSSREVSPCGISTPWETSTPESPTSINSSSTCNPAASISSVIWLTKPRIVNFSTFSIFISLAT